MVSSACMSPTRTSISAQTSYIPHLLQGVEKTRDRVSSLLAPYFGNLIDTKTRGSAKIQILWNIIHLLFGGKAAHSMELDLPSISMPNKPYLLYIMFVCVHATIYE